MSTIEERVLKVLAERCEVPPDASAETALASLDLDSLTLLEVGFGLQSEFQARVDDAVVADAETVGDLVRAVESCVSEA
ncbi:MULTISPECIES: phosphopantetheine-binding protein [unclassified Streptomyces]|uniref:phosphopantetheine-binding protein n=1 Tax=unclassified Streptomyces TaxID=2593676 RepID=UPI002E30E037|nr:phosphopantetheine-binding protein [Streptomyces sp. NBC_01477]